MRSLLPQIAAALVTLVLLAPGEAHASGPLSLVVDGRVCATVAVPAAEVTTVPAIRGKPGGTVYVIDQTGAVLGSSTIPAAGPTTLFVMTDGQVRFLKVNFTGSAVAIPLGTLKPPFLTPPLFSANGLALTVFKGSVAELEAATLTVGASGAWMQDATGEFRLLVAGSPFLRDAFGAMFSGGFSPPAGVVLIR